MSDVQHVITSIVPTLVEGQPPIMDMTCACGVHVAGLSGDALFNEWEAQHAAYFQAQAVE